MNNFNFFNYFEKRLIVLHYWQHYIRMTRLSDKSCFANGVSIKFPFWIPVLFLSLRLFYLSTSSLLISFIIAYLLDFLPFQALNFLIDSFFFYLGFLSRTFANHRTAGEVGGHFFNSSLPLPHAPQTLRH